MASALAATVSNNVLPVWSDKAKTFILDDPLHKDIHITRVVVDNHVYLMFADPADTPGIVVIEEK